MKFDLAFVKFAASLREHAGAFFTPVLKIITYSGTAGIAFILAGLALLFFKKTRKMGTVACFAIFFGAVITNLLIKNIVARPRPYFDTTSEFYPLWVAAGGMVESEYSFPSGHATVSAAFCVALFWVCNKKYSWSFLIIPLIMGFSRIYFVVHYATDVCGGLLAGTLCACLAYLTVTALEKWSFFRKCMELDLIAMIKRKLKKQPTNEN